METQTLTATVTGPNLETTAHARPPSLQRRAAAQSIADAAAILANVTQDTALLALLAPHGFDAEAFDAGLALQQAAQDAYNARQQSMSAQAIARDALRACFDTLSRDVMDYRLVGRALFRQRTTRTALSLRGPLPEDQFQYVQHVRAVYQLAMTTPQYATAFARRGYTTTKFTQNLAALDAWVQAVGAQTAAAADSIRATQARNAALDALDAWMYQLRTAGRIASRDHPEVAVKLGL